MIKNIISDKKLFAMYFSQLLIFGFVLFVLSARLSEPFRKLADALISSENTQISVWLASCTMALLYGALWLCVYLLFDASKKGMVDLLHKK